MDTLFLNANCQPLCLLPMSIVRWQVALKSIYTEKATVLLSYEDRYIHSPSITLNVPSVIILNEYKRPKRFPVYNRDMIFLRDEYTCQYCGLDAYKENCRDLLTLDHYIPKSKGGKTNFENIVTACMSCNMEKANHDHMKPKTIPHKPTYYHVPLTHLRAQEPARKFVCGLRLEKKPLYLP